MSDVERFRHRRRRRRNPPGLRRAPALSHPLRTVVGMLLLTALDRALLVLLRVGIAAFGALLGIWVLLLAFAGTVALAS